MIKRLTFLVIVLLISTEISAQIVENAWVRRYNGPGNADDRPSVVVVDDSGNVYVTGRSYGNETTMDYLTIKYFPNGDVAWLRRYDGPGNSNDSACGMTKDNFGNVYVTGMSIGNGTTGDYATVKYRSDGSIGWVSRYNGSGNNWDYPKSITSDNWGNVYVTGMSIGDFSFPEYATIKYDSSGIQNWAKTYSSPDTSWSCANAIAVDDSGYVYVTGDSWTEATGFDYATIKYYPDGEVVWMKRFNGLSNDCDLAQSLAVDGPSGIVVTGYSWKRETGFDYVTIRYYPNGDMAWMRSYNGSGNSDDYANAMAVDRGGNIYVTGRSEGNGTDMDYVTIKYDSSGTELWVKRYNGPGNWEDNASAIATDDSGNLYVTGWSLSPDSWYDYASLKYDSLGNELWVKRDDGPGMLGDYACALALDKSGDIYVTGYSQDGITSYDYTTIKYIQVEYNHPPNPFSLLFPPNKAFTPRLVHFDWQTAVDPDLGTAVKYDLYISTSYRFPPDSTIVDHDLIASDQIKRLDLVTYFWKVKAYDDYGGETWCEQYQYFTVTGMPNFLVGDFTADCSIDIADVIFGLNYVYRSGEAPEPLESGDTDCDGSVDIVDIVCIVDYLFRSSPPPNCQH